MRLLIECAFEVAQTNLDVKPPTDDEIVAAVFQTAKGGLATLTLRRKTAVLSTRAPKPDAVLTLTEMKVHRQRPTNPEPRAEPAEAGSSSSPDGRADSLDDPVMP